ncbi:uncharacterized protein LOC121873461 [Homarus americanus]|uniref:uncharacterized protein LOC121873461 n=1 Tax=Homarus americanus TaxID=6706 RepID=UPI001C47E7DC|nr:uncharacterized protein LOC121873461 [Homarus americanus]
MGTLKHLVLDTFNIITEFIQKVIDLTVDLKAKAEGTNLVECHSVTYDIREDDSNCSSSTYLHIVEQMIAKLKDIVENLKHDIEKAPSSAPQVVHGSEGSSDNESSEESLENSGDGTESLESQKMTNPSSFIVPADIKPALVKHPPVDSLVENDDGSGMVLSANIITSSSNALPGTILPSSFSNTFSTASVHQSSQITGITDPTSILASSLNVGPSLCETSYGDQTQVIKCIKVSDECETFL